MLLDGTGDYQMFDNIAVGDDGNIIIQEDPGGQKHNAKVWRYQIASGALEEIAHHDPARFGDINLPATLPFKHGEESSGVIDVTEIFGAGKNRYYLMDVQPHHKINDPEIIEGGQLLLVRIAVP